MDFYAQIGDIFNPTNNPFFGTKKHEDDAVIIKEIPNEKNNDYE